jgi:hypothetical protein
MIPRFALGHSAPASGSAEALPEILTAKERRGVPKNRREDDLQLRAAWTHPAYADRVKCPLLETPGPAVAQRAQFRAPTGERQGRQAPMKTSDRPKAPIPDRAFRIYA